MRRLAVAAWLLSLILVGCAARDDAVVTDPPAQPITFARCEGVTGDGGAAPLCGQLVFAGQGSPRDLRIGVVAERADDPFEERAVLVYHPGGPGVSAVSTLLADPPDMDLGRFTLVTWDGATASSTPGSCGSAYSEFAIDRSIDSLAALVPPAAESCLRGFGAESGFGAATAARELDAVRSALGVEQIDLLTHSYGTAIAEAYANTYPGHLRRAVLDGPLALEVPWQARLEAIDASLGELSGRLFASCETEGCGDSLSELLERGGYAAARSAVGDDLPLVGTSQVVLTPTMLD